MSATDAWLAGRRPPPPRELARRLGGAGEADDEAPLVDELAHRGLAALERARRAPGRVRESAYHLLTADALLTYAAEAALETPDPSAVLRKLVALAASPDR